MAPGFDRDDEPDRDPSLSEDLDIARWIAQLVDDERLVQLAAEALATDPLVCGRYMSIAVQNGVVVLEGELESDEAREAARRRAWSVPGIRDVCSMLSVAGLPGGEHEPPSP